MQFIQGQGLDAVLDELKAAAARGPSPREPRRLLAGTVGDAAERRRGRSLTGRFAEPGPQPAERRTRSLGDSGDGSGDDARRATRRPVPARPVRSTRLPSRDDRHYDRSVAPGRRPGGRGAGLRPRARASSTATSSRRTCCSTPQGTRLGHRLRPGQGRGRRRPDRAPATSSARCATWRRSGSGAGPTRGATSTRWG